MSTSITHETAKTEYIEAGGVRFAYRRRLILAGTGPGGGEKYVPGGPEIRPMASRPALGLEEQQFLFFTTSEKSKAAGEAYWQRLKSRVGEIEPPVSQEGVKAQLQALVAWGQGDSAYNRLAESGSRCLSRTAPTT